MATIRKEFKVIARADQAWAALADFQAVDKRIAPGFVVDSRPDPGPTGEARIVTFANGTSAREILVTSDAKTRRLVYAVVGNDRLKHHSASAEIIADGNACRFVWTADFLPNEVAPYIDGQMEQGAAVIRQTLDKLG
jgi:hypothetical protein